MAEKPPAFQFYPRDWDTDDNVTPMTYEEEGVYWALCRRYWLNGNTLPAEINELHSKLKATEGKKRDRRMPREKFEQIWERVGRCFKVVDGRLTHKRLDQERAKQLENKAKRTKAAEERWSREEARRTASQTPSNDAHASDVHMHGPSTVQSLASSSSSASSIASATADVEPGQQQQPRGANVQAGPWESPRRVDRSHTGHVFGFCQFKCVSEEKLNEFAKDLPRGLDDPENFNRVLAWAKTVRDGWGDKPKLEPKWFDFWEARWAEHQSQFAAASDPYVAAHAAVAREMERQQREREAKLR